MPVYSARLHTQDLFTVQYGRIEVRAKIPSGDWLWPGGCHLMGLTLPMLTT